MSYPLRKFGIETGPVSFQPGPMDAKDYRVEPGKKYDVHRADEGELQVLLGKKVTAVGQQIPPVAQCLAPFGIVVRRQRDASDLGLQPGDAFRERRRLRAPNGREKQRPARSSTLLALSTFRRLGRLPISPWTSLSLTPSLNQPGACCP